MLLCTDSFEWNTPLQNVRKSPIPITVRAEELVDDALNPATFCWDTSQKETPRSLRPPSYGSWRCRSFARCISTTHPPEGNTKGPGNTTIWLSQILFSHSYIFTGFSTWCNTQAPSVVGQREWDVSTERANGDCVFLAAQYRRRQRELWERTALSVSTDNRFERGSQWRNEQAIRPRRQTRGYYHNYPWDTDLMHSASLRFTSGMCYIR